ncbi:hypothetical protein SEVIR_1G142601v4 [Setaria viridis]
MRVTVQILTTGIRAVLSCSLNISCSQPSPATFRPQPVAEAPAVPAHSSPSTQTSGSSSEAASSPRSPPVARYVRRTVSALGRLERTTSAGGRARCGRGAYPSGGGDRCGGGKGVEAGGGGAGCSKDGSGSGGGGRCRTCGGSGARDSTWR